MRKRDILEADADRLVDDDVSWPPVVMRALDQQLAELDDAGAVDHAGRGAHKLAGLGRGGGQPFDDDQFGPRQQRVIEFAPARPGRTDRCDKGAGPHQCPVEQRLGRTRRRDDHVACVHGSGGIHRARRHAKLGLHPVGEVRRSTASRDEHALERTGHQQRLGVRVRLHARAKDRQRARFARREPLHRHCRHGRRAQARDLIGLERRERLAGDRGEQNDDKLGATGNGCVHLGADHSGSRQRGAHRGDRHRLLAMFGGGPHPWHDRSGAIAELLERGGHRGDGVAHRDDFGDIGVGDQSHHVLPTPARWPVKCAASAGPAAATRTR